MPELKTYVVTKTQSTIVKAGSEKAALSVVQQWELWDSADWEVEEIESQE